MIINPVELIRDNTSVRIQSLIEYAGKREYLWFSMDKRYEASLTTEKLDGFLAGVLMLAMKHGEDVHVNGAISAKLFYNLSNHYIKILTLLYPELRTVNITCDGLDEGTSYRCEGGAVTGFSAGIDSFCTVYDHIEREQPRGYGITHFIFNNVGSHGEWETEKARHLFNNRYEMIGGYPAEVGIEFIKVDSNLSDILQMDFQMAHTLRNASAVLLFQKLFGKYYYASSYSYQDCRIGPTYDMSFSDPVAMHLLSTETLECIPSGSQYTRVEKTDLVARVEASYRYLNVCVSLDIAGKNCSICWKCCRTLLTLEILGKIDRYERVFDLDRYHKVKSLFIATLLENRNNPFHAEIIELAEKMGYHFPVWSRALSLLLSIFRGKIRQRLHWEIQSFLLKH